MLAAACFSADASLRSVSYFKTVMDVADSGDIALLLGQAVGLGYGQASPDRYRRQCWAQRGRAQGEPQYDNMAYSLTPAPAPEAAITVSPERAAVGARLTVSGTSFAPGEQVRLELHSTPVLLATVTADAQGRFTATLTVPRVAPGAHQVVATGDSSGR